MNTNIFTSRCTRTRLIALALASATVIAACGGGDDDEAAAPTTTAAEATTTSKKPAASTTAGATTTTAAATTTTAAPVPTAPLTGLPQTVEAYLNRPALVVKIDNHSAAVPQTGLNQADIVYEEEVEGISRFAAVFQSTDATWSQDNPELAVVGPVRSARTTDIDIMAGLSRPLLAWSGGNAGVVRAVNGAQDNGELTDVGYSQFSKEGGWFRDRSRKAPHNLYANMRAVYTLAPADQGPPAPVFEYRGPTDTMAGEDALGVKVKIDGTQVQWQWDADSQAWLRFQNGDPHEDSNGQVINPANVVVMFVDYKGSSAAASSPEAITVGEGDVWVFTGGKLVRGTWKRDDRVKPATLTDEAGNPIKLTPGRTWVELPRPGGANVIPAGADPDTVDFP